MMAMIGILAWHASLLWKNNQATEIPDRKLLSVSLEKATDWLVNNDEILKDNNPILWWMLKQASEITGNPRLSDFFRQYKVQHLNNKPLNIWSRMFYPYSHTNLPQIELLDNLPYYNFFSCTALPVTGK